jgi:hypothetical protein
MSFGFESRTLNVQLSKTALITYTLALHECYVAYLSKALIPERFLCIRLNITLSQSKVLLSQYPITSLSVKTLTSKIDIVKVKRVYN